MYLSLEKICPRMVKETTLMRMEMRPWNGKKKPISITQKLLSNFTQYSGKQPMGLDMTDPKLSERMDQLEKTINASTTPKNQVCRLF